MAVQAAKQARTGKVTHQAAFGQVTLDGQIARTGLRSVHLVALRMADAPPTRRLLLRFRKRDEAPVRFRGPPHQTRARVQLVLVRPMAESVSSYS
jgi:hypothetical protein